MTTIDELLAKSAICDVQITYCRAIDRMDFDLLRSCFHPDATTDFGFQKGGLDDFLAMARTSLARFSGTTHFTGNQLVQLRGHSAWAEHYTVATHRCPADEQGPVRDLITAVRYVDRMEQRQGAWRIATRVLVLDWWRVDPVNDAGEGPQVTLGQRDRSDASYHV
jgi:SnoaL-like protein